jgi:hypothetical protein
MKKYNIKNVDIIWMDLQGAELLALKGLGEYIKNVEFIHTEVSYKEIYNGQVMFDELNKFVLLNDFIVINQLSMCGWQEDIIYQKKFNDLTIHNFNKYSQRGSDGMLLKIMHELNIEKGFFIEFGGWDGIYLSNSKYLFDKGWDGCFIEADYEKFKELKNNYINTNIICINEFIYPTNNEGLTIDDIYKLYIKNKEIDLLSIDIDGRDYEIFENMKIKPKLIIIEGGFAWHPHMEKKIPYDIAKNNLQQPLSVMIELAKNKGYQPIAFNQDTFLLRDDLYYTYKYFQLIKNDPYSLWMSAFKNIYTNEDREWLIDFRSTNETVKLFENNLFLCSLY